MNVFADTNVIVKCLDPTAAEYHVARRAVVSLQAAGHDICILPQNYYEFWVVATRPVVNRGLGMNTASASVLMSSLATTFIRLDDPPDLLGTWLDLVLKHDCKGKIAHDVRLVAAMSCLGVSHLLTFNGRDFARFPGIAVQDPAGLP